MLKSLLVGEIVPAHVRSTHSGKGKDMEETIERVFELTRNEKMEEGKSIGTRELDKDCLGWKGPRGSGPLEGPLQWMEVAIPLGGVRCLATRGEDTEEF
jgi:hypothetical protein